MMPPTVHLGEGEKEVLALGLEHPNTLLLLDDRHARRHAEVRLLRVTGTLGILLLAKNHHLLNTIRPVVDRLDALGFRLHSATRSHVLRLAGEDL